MSICMSLRPHRLPAPCSTTCAQTRKLACQAAAPLKYSSERVDKNKSQVVAYDDLEFVVDENPELKSTWDHRRIVWSSALVSMALFAQGVAHSDSIVSTGLAMFGGFIFAGVVLLAAEL
jgi:hypothetical protein